MTKKFAKSRKFLKWICKHIRSTETITNPQNGTTIKINDGGTCKSSKLIYAATCKKCKLIYVGETGCSLADRFGKHRHDNELAKHFHKDHHLNDLEVLILQTGLSKSRAQREQFEDRWICKLQTKTPTGINEKLNHYAKEMYNCFKEWMASTLQGTSDFRYRFDVSWFYHLTSIIIGLTSQSLLFLL